MKILIAGKGGVGKTTISALLSLELAERGFEVLALDTDSTPNLAISLGVPYEEADKITPLSKNEKLVENRTGARPGEWGAVFSLTPKVDDLIESYGIKINEKLSLFVVGSIDQGKEGCLCPAIALAKALLRHVLSGDKPIVVVDSEAGAEVFGRGLAEKFDIMLCVSEPTYKSLKISEKLLRMGRDLRISRELLLINKVQDEDIRGVYEEIFAKHPIPWIAIEFDESLKVIEGRKASLSELPASSPLKAKVKMIAEHILGR